MSEMDVFTIDIKWSRAIKGRSLKTKMIKGDKRNVRIIIRTMCASTYSTTRAAWSPSRAGDGDISSLTPRLCFFF